MVAEFCPKCPATVTACLAPTLFRWVEEEDQAEQGGSLEEEEEEEEALC